MKKSRHPSFASWQNAVLGFNLVAERYFHISHQHHLCRHVAIIVILKVVCDGNMDKLNDNDDHHDEDHEEADDENMDVACQDRRGFDDFHQD